MSAFTYYREWQKAEQQAEAYHFTNEQMDLMKELLSAEFRPQMLAILGKDMVSDLDVVAGIGSIAFA